MNNKSIWVFPKYLNFSDFIEFNLKFESFDKSNNLFIDMSNTEEITSLFAGCLIHAQATLLKKNKRIELIVSESVKKTLKMLGVLNYLTSETIESKKKTA